MPQITTEQTFYSILILILIILIFRITTTVRPTRVSIARVMTVVVGVLAIAVVVSLITQAVGHLSIDARYHVVPKGIFGFGNHDLATQLVKKDIPNSNTFHNPTDLTSMGV